ncbi:hypothetical protein Y032_0070g463 [Ancylostoma ceylanicum]|uniref:Uncharacterized protein n=1 Tax=Ancylostoma ceylanicum TaxID=53326 RepID=A0A016TY24_9BILA|nr:hypothetical protein Y032_0070g463 [Ancylostoma ceylanicum]
MYPKHIQGREDGILYQAVVQFSFDSFMYKASSCMPSFTVAIAYVKNPPPDDNDYCHFETTQSSNMISCRRREYLLQDENWIRVTLKNFLYTSLPYQKTRILRCLLKIMHVLNIPEIPKSAPAITTPKSTPKKTSKTTRTTRRTTTRKTTTLTARRTTTSPITTRATTKIPTPLITTSTTTTTTAKITTTAEKSRAFNSTYTNAPSNITSERGQQTLPHATVLPINVSEWPLKPDTSTSSKQVGAHIGGAFGAKKEPTLSKDPNFTSLAIILAPLITLKLILLVLLILTIRYLRRSYKPPKNRSLKGKPTAVPPRSTVSAPVLPSPNALTRKQSTIVVDLWDTPHKPEKNIKSVSKDPTQPQNAKIGK